MGYSRAVRRGSFVFVSETTATDGSGGIGGAGDPPRADHIGAQQHPGSAARCGD